MKNSSFFKQNRVLNTVVRLGMLTVLVVSTFAQARPAQADGVPSGFSEYYIPGGANQMLAILDNIDTTNLSASTMTYIITISVGAPVTIYYDHWENGYSTTPAGGDEVYNKVKGDVLTFRSSNVPNNHDIIAGNMNACSGSIFPSGGSPSGVPTYCYDGRDRIYVVGGAVSVAQVTWPTTADTNFANAWEVYPTKPYQTDYTIPVGENLCLTGSPGCAYPDFDNVYVIAQATQDGTNIQIDNPGTVLSPDVNVTLNRGQVTQLWHINTGTTVHADFPVQVQFIIGEDAVSSNAYNSKAYTAVPSGLWSTEYYSPVPGASSADTDIFVYNPSGSALTIEYTDSTNRPGFGTFEVAANSTESYFTNTGHYVPLNSPVYLKAQDGVTKFWAIGAADTGGPTYNWGFPLIPPSELTSEYFVSWAPGGWTQATSLPSQANLNPIYVTPVLDNTTIWVDDSAAGTVNQTYTLNRFYMQRIFDSFDADNTGLHIWATGPISIVWGQDADVARSVGGGASPGLDAGYTILPMNQEWIDVVLTMDKTANPDSISAASGQVSTFTLVTKTDLFGLSGVTVQDILPSGWAYVSGSTNITLPNATTITGAAANPVISGGGLNLLWNDFSFADPPDPDPLNMNGNETLTIVYQAQTTSVPTGTYVVNEAIASGTYNGNIFSGSDTATIAISQMAVTKVSNSGGDSDGIVNPGDTVLYTTTITNNGGTAQNNIVVNDPLPVGTTYMVQSTSVLGFVAQTAGDAFNTVSSFAGNQDSNGATDPTWLGNWTELGENDGASTGNVGVLQDTVFTANQLRLQSITGIGVLRNVDTSSCLQLNLSLNYRRVNLDDTGDLVRLSIGTGGTAPNTLVDFTGPTNDTIYQSYNVDISSYINTITTIQLLSNSLENNDTIWFDNIIITCYLSVSKDNIPGGGNDLLNGTPATLVTALDSFDLFKNQSMTVTYRVTVNNPTPVGQTSVINTAGVTSDQQPIALQATATDTLPSSFPVATIAVSPASVAEDGATNLVYTVTLNQAPVVDTTINLTTTGTATSGTDYTGGTATVTITAGNTTGTVTIDPTPDTVVELDETVILTINTGTGYTVGMPASATGTITDNDLPVATIAVSPASVAEDGVTNLVYTVTLNQAPVVDTTINLTTTGTATSGTDYTGGTATVTITAGNTTGTVTIDPTPDTVVELDETVILTINTGTGYTVGMPASATGTIIDNDLPVATIAVSPASVAEDGATNLVYTVTLNQAPVVDTTINLTTTGTATSGTDYTGGTATVTITAGNTTGTVTIDPTPDTVVELDETVILMINTGTGYTVGMPASATGTITDNDLPVATIAVSPASVAEDGVTNLVYTVTLNQAPVVDTTINLTTTGTATSGTDYTGGTATVTITAGNTTGTVTIDPTPDTVVELDETVILTINTGTGYTVGMPASATGTIIDNDLPVATIAVSPASVAEDGATNLVYTVTLNQAPVVDTTINLTTTGTATSGTDYTGGTATVTITAGNTTGTVTIDPTPDTVVELDETVILTINTGTGYTVGMPASATGTITDNDLPVATIAVSPASVAEDGVTNLVYTVTLNQAPVVDTTINLTTTGTATSGTDYTGGTATVTITAGNTTGTVTIDPTPDTVVELDETVILTINTGTGYTVGMPASATGTIIDNDATSLIGVAKRMVGTPVLVSPGTWDVTFEILVKNYSSVALSALQVTDNLTSTFPLPTTFTVRSVTSTAFTENWPGYNGSSNINLLTGVDTLAVEGQGTITLVVRIIPASSGPFYNTAVASAAPPTGDRVSDSSTDGTDPDSTTPCTAGCVNGDNDPTNNTKATPVTFTAHLFDPPFGVKVINESGLPELEWTMVWINGSNLVAVNAAVNDEIPLGTTYVTGSLSCSGASSLTITTSCAFEVPGITPRGRILWTGEIGPDFGATDAATAVNELYITFRVTVNPGVISVQNEASIDSDLDGNGSPTDPGEIRVATARASWPSEQPAALPATGFAPGRVTTLPLQDAPYADLGNLWLEVPRLGVKMPIVGVPQSNGEWDVTWLGDQAGWLNGTAFPTWEGNSVITGHVYDAFGRPAPFVHLNWLWYGDKIIVHAWGGEYVYEVRQVKSVVPEALSTALKHEELPWVTLVTCRGYDETSNSYKYRVLVRAVLVEVK